MNCWPGCLAVVVKVFKGHDVERASRGLTDRRGAIVRTVRIENGLWRLESPLRIAYTFFGPHGMDIGQGDIDALADDYLRPIRGPGDDAVDETLLRLPSPRQEVTA